eukprot:11401478-Alexandrium_andersonii.AAC.1
MAICRYRHHAMVLTIITVMARSPTSAQTQYPERSRGPFCAVVRAECDSAQNGAEPPRTRPSGMEFEVVPGPA